MKKIVDGTQVSVKDENGSYVPSHLIPKPAPQPAASIDDLLNRCLTAIDRATKNLLTLINDGDVSRETIGSLKDCTVMLRDLKKDEKDIIEDLTDEQLEQILGRRQK